MIFGSNPSINQELSYIKSNDLITEILLRLPLNSLLKLKCVCKWWCQLISHPIFIANYSLRNPDLHVSGLFVQKFLLFKMYPDLKFIAFEGTTDTLSTFSLSFIKDENGVFIQHSCNGLLLCSSFRCHEYDRNYYICQPKTRQYFLLPSPQGKVVFGINIAFDPLESSYIRVVCVTDSQDSTHHRQIKVYTSEQRLWRDSGKPFVASDDMLFSRGGLWNGALHWASRGDVSLRFDIEQEVLLEMPMPSIREGQSERELGYFGVSGQFLYLVHIYGSRTTVFDVMQMKNDSSGWFVKYHIDLTGVLLHYQIGVGRFSFSIMYLGHQCIGPEEKSFIMLHIPGKLISYNLGDMTFVELQDLSSDPLSSGLYLQSNYSWERLHSYTNTCYYMRTYL